jgi:hypothetical protein
MWNAGKWMTGTTPGEIEQQEHLDMLSNYKDYYLQRHNKYLRLQATRIHIKDVSELSIPHCFYYACPEGLIKPQEVPDYAGLIYIGESGARIIVKAPFMHKRDCNITSVLLSKFYYETVKHRLNNFKNNNS